MPDKASKDTDSEDGANRTQVAGAVNLPLSVVIPTHNSASQLRLCLEALSRNRTEGVEIVVVDDASSDETSKVIEDSASRIAVPLSCVRLERQSGPAFARNAGLRAAANRHVLFLDADVLLPEHGIESLRATLARYGDRSEIVGAMGIYSESTPSRDFLSDYKNLHVCFLHKTTETISPYLHTPILCVEKRIIEEEGGFDTSLETAEDFRMGVKLGSKGCRFVIDREVRGVHLKHYELRSLFREDWRRVRDLLRIQMEEGQQRFLVRAHRISRLLSAALPLPTIAAVAVIPWYRAGAVLAIGLGLVFCLCNLDFLKYLRERRDFGFALRSAGVLFLEMLCAQIALLYWTGRNVLGAATKAPRHHGH